MANPEWDNYNPNYIDPIDLKLRCQRLEKEIEALKEENFDLNQRLNEHEDYITRALKVLNEHDLDINGIYIR